MVFQRLSRMSRHYTNPDNHNRFPSHPHTRLGARAKCGLTTRHVMPSVRKHSQKYRNHSQPHLLKHKTYQTAPPTAMATRLGITPSMVSPRELTPSLNNQTTLFHNPSYDTLFEHVMAPTLSGYEKGQLTTSGAVAVDTGEFTGRSAKDKYVVTHPDSEALVWWKKDGSDNQPLSTSTWDALKRLSMTQLNTSKKLYVMDGFCGANKSSQLSVRLVTEVAWQAHFFKNMFIRPSHRDLETFKPDWTIYNACKTSCDNYQELGLRSKNYVAFNLEQRETVIAGTWYGGEIKKGIFSIMNYFLPLQGIGSFHCSANQGHNGETALFFGLSGTGKTTLSADPKRLLIGDDEHGWDDEGVFNLEGGCYAKTIDLSPENEPDIYKAVKRNALLENVVVTDSNDVDFGSNAKTDNTRVSYPIHHIDKIVTPISKGTHPTKIIFLTCDAKGVLPPVSKLSKEEAMFQYLSGYTSKVAGTEIGVTEPSATFSTCFGKPFLLLHPTQYARILGQKMTNHNADAYLVNTGWSGGAYGTGNRIKLPYTRSIIDAILDGSIEKSTWEKAPVFNFNIPRDLPHVPSEILNPKNTWSDQALFTETAQDLLNQFNENFKKFSPPTVTT